MKALAHPVKRTAWPVSAWSCTHTPQIPCVLRINSIRMPIAESLKGMGGQGSQGQAESRCMHPQPQKNPFYFQPQACSPPAPPRWTYRMGVVQEGCIGTLNCWLLNRLVIYKSLWAIGHPLPTISSLHSPVHHPHSLVFLKVWGSHQHNLKINSG